MRSWLHQRMQSSIRASTSSRIRSSQRPGWTDSVFMRPKNPSAAALSGGTALRARRPYQAVAVHERQPSGPPAVASAVGTTKGCAPSGSVSAALTSILLASPASGPEPAVPVPALGSGERLRHLRPEPGVSVNGEPGVVAVGGCSARCRASVSSSRVNTSGADGRPEASSPCPTGAIGRRPGLFLRPPPPPASPRSPVPAPRPAGAGPRRRRRPDPVAPLACRTGRRSCSRSATRPYRPRDTP